MSDQVKERCVNGVKRGLEILRESRTIPLFAVLICTVVLLAVMAQRTAGSGMTQLELRVSNALSQVDGVGSTEVVIRTAKQGQSSQSLGGYRDGEEVPCGAIVVAQGGNDPLVRMELTNALCALLGLHASQVEVIGMSEGE